MRAYSVGTFTVVALLVASALSCRKVYPPEAEPDVGGPVQTTLSWPSLAQSPWPMHHHDPQSTGRSSQPGPQKGQIVWTFRTPGPVASSPVIGPDSTIYFVTAYDTSERVPGVFLYALDWRGRLKWKRPLRGQEAHAVSDHSCSPLVGANGTIYVGSRDAHLYAFDPTGDLLWTYEAGGDIYCTTLNIGLDGTIYFTAADEVLYAVGADGQPAWTSVELRFDPGLGVSISPDGQVLYVPFLGHTTSDSAGIAAVDLTGHVLWKRYTGLVGSLPLVDNQGNVYFVAGRGKGSTEERTTGVYSYSASGDLRWHVPAAYVSAGIEPTLDEQANLYVHFGRTGVDWFLTSLDYAGNTRWQVGGDLARDPVASLVCDAKDNVYGIFRPEIPQRASLVRITPGGHLSRLADLGPVRGNSPAIAWGKILVGTWYAPGGDGVLCIE